MPAIEPSKWLAFLRTEYLEGFIKAGGTSVKFVVPLDKTLVASLNEDITTQADQCGYIATKVSSADTRVHLVDQIFFRIAEQVPWEEMSRRAVTRLAKEAGYAIPTAASREPLGEALASLNRVDRSVVAMDVRRWVSSSIFRSLSRDFRVSMTQLCLAAIAGGSNGETVTNAITDWLTGRNKAVGAVRPYQLFSRISRSNARHLLESLLLWAPFCGYAGLLLVLDISRVTIPRNPRDDVNYYTKAAMLDAYEVLRQFIDSTEQLKNCLVVVVADGAFLDVEPDGRGMGAYNALKLRVYDDIHDERLVNPMAALVRLAL